MFQPIKAEQLISGKKYKFMDGTGIFIHSVYWDDKMYYFENVKIQKRPNVTQLYLFNRTFEQFVSQQPHWKMERRAVNLIVRRLIGDDNFEW
jgi:hypothetical protein